MALVQGKMIRYVHIPDEVDAISNLEKHVSHHHKTVFLTILYGFCLLLFSFGGYLPSLTCVVALARLTQMPPRFFSRFSSICLIGFMHASLEQNVFWPLRLRLVLKLVLTLDQASKLPSTKVVQFPSFWECEPQRRGSAMGVSGII